MSDYRAKKVEQINQYVHVVLIDGREGCIVEVFDQDRFIVDVGSSPADRETISIDDRAEIITVVHR